MPEFDPRQSRILRAALDLPTSERDDYVQRECGDDTALLASMRQLLDIDAATALPLDRPAQAHAAELVADEPRDAPHLRAGDRIGPYRLVRELGHGGMGSVWLARRDDGQFEQQVALKLIRLGMDSEYVARQFRRERALLARLQHPNIAQLIDGGIDARGRPWFAMEYVDGVGLSQWLRTCPDLRTRLQLFAKLCLAVAHAHRQLIVHRDLKPSNVLVQADGEPRLLDFGIARLVEVDETGERTATAQRFLTRDFAAPEQLRGEIAGTSADVYALGLILFELLTGQRYRTLHAGNETTLRPSAALDTTTATSAGISRLQLRGDLDAITLRALADEPARRYADAQQLAEDVQRHLDGKPVAARPDRLAYRSAKFVRRHRAAVTVGALGLMALLMASGVALWQAAQKTIEAERARAALRQSEAVRTFMTSVFAQADPLQTRGTDTTAGEILASARERVTHELANEPAVAAELLNQIGNIYVSLGADTLARSTLHEALALNAKTAAPSPRIAAQAGGRLAYYDYLDGHAQPALDAIERILHQLRQAGTEDADVLAKTLQLQAQLLFSTGHTEAALRATAAAVQVLRPQAGRWNAEYINALIGHADAAAGVGRGAEALASAELALAQPLLASRPDSVTRLAALGAKVRALQALHREADAEPTLDEVIRGFSALYGANNSRTRYWRYRRAQLLQALGRLDAAQTAVDALVAQPADDTDQPVARIAALVTAADIALARRAPDAASRRATAEAQACAGGADTPFCRKARQLRAATP